MRSKSRTIRHLWVARVMVPTRLAFGRCCCCSPGTFLRLSLLHNGLAMTRRISAAGGGQSQIAIRRTRTDHGREVDHPPTDPLPGGHPLGPNQVLVGHQACLGHAGGHTTWTCLRCDETVNGPPLDTHCATLDGPATVRISSGRT